MKRSLTLVLFSAVVSCVNVENNVPASGGGNVFAAGANNGTGNPATCRAACQNATTKCGPLEDSAGQPVTVDSCANQCVQIAPPPALITCVSTAPTCDAIYSCGDSAPEPQKPMATCRSTCERLMYLCGPLRDENGDPMTVDQCDTKCQSSGAPQGALDCMSNAQTCSAVQSCA